MIKSSNPAMKPFANPQTWAEYQGSSAVAKNTTMTYGGVAQATGIQLACAVLGAAGGWSAVQSGLVGGLSIGLMLGLMGVTWILGAIMRRNPKISIVLGPIGSVVFGFIAGLFSYVIALAMGGILIKNPGLVGAGEGLTRADLVAKGAGVVFQAIMLTLGVVASMAIATATGLISVRGMFAKVVMFSTGAIMLTYVVGMLLRAVFSVNIPMIHEVGPIGIAFSAVVVVVASLNLAMQFAMVQDSIRAGAPKFMEWYAGYAIISTVIWLYIEILILLYKIYAMTRH